MLISKTRFTTKNYFKIPFYEFYDTKHPAGAAHGGTAILIQKSIKHFKIQKYPEESLQATSISVEDWKGSLVISVMYCPPKHKSYSTALGIDLLLEEITITPPIRDIVGNWARSNKDKAFVFANHLANVFEPIPSTIIQEEHEIHQFLEAPHQMHSQISQ